MVKIIHRAADRGQSEHGWLSSRFSFSFADWHDPERMGFGALRVINDDVIAPLGKFGMHPHRNYEIITIPLSGAVTHEDSMGNKGSVRAGEVQVMSAGAGIVHSEYNASPAEPLVLFQIWIAPNAQHAVPRYAQKAFDPILRKNAWQVLVAEDDFSGALAIYQHARVARADLEGGREISYDIAHQGNGAYILVIEGEVEIAGEKLSKRDAIGVEGESHIIVRARSAAEILLIEVPMQ